MILNFTAVSNHVQLLRQSMDVPSAIRLRLNYSVLHVAVLCRRHDFLRVSSLPATPTCSRPLHLGTS